MKGRTTNAVLIFIGLIVPIACKNKHEDRRVGSPPDAATASTTNIAKYVPLAETQPPSRYASPPKEAAPSRPVCDGATIRSPEVVAALQVLSDTSHLSRAFLDNCADCHGLVGEGRDAYPRLAGPNDAALFKKIVREGRGNMPAFPASLVTESDLDADLLALARAPTIPTDLPPLFQDASLIPPSPIADADYGVAMTTGLNAWRNPGESGSCAACHGPDGIDLARIGYSNATILRRALAQGRTPQEGQAIVAMIGAQRQRFAISEPCSPTFFRPLQPGGSVLAGKDAGEVDFKLEVSLKERGVAPEPAEINNAKSAQAFADKVLALDESSIAIGIALNRWTSDGFHGASAVSTAEWIPELPMEPRTAEVDARWASAQNRYLEDSSAENFWSLYDMVGELDASRIVDGGVAERLSREKYRSVLVLQHMMRSNDRSFPDLHGAKGLLRFSMWETGQVATVMLRGCGEDGTSARPYPCWNYPKKFSEKMGVDRDALLLDAQRLVLPWLTVGLLVDPNLQFTENGDAQIQHWHDAFKDAASAQNLGIVPGQLPLHEVYFGLLRLAKSVEGFDKSLPSGHGFDRQSVNGCWNSATAGLTQWTKATLASLDSSDLEGRSEGRRAEAAAIAVNRMALYLIKAALEAPKPLCKEQSDPKVLAALVKTLGDWGLPGQVANKADNQSLATEVALAIK